MSDSIVDNISVQQIVLSVTVIVPHTDLLCVYVYVCVGRGILLILAFRENISNLHSQTLSIRVSITTFR